MKELLDYTLDISPDEQVSENFQYWELIKSETAAKHGIDNRITDIRTLHNAIYSARELLQPIRDTFGPLVPNSVYRNQAVERAYKKKPDTWVSISQHTKGEAVDVEVIGVSTIDLALWCRANLDFDQLILECYNPALGKNSGWVHISTSRHRRNRADVKSYIFTGHGYEYVDGLIEDLRG